LFCVGVFLLFGVFWCVFFVWGLFGGVVGGGGGVGFFFFGGGGGGRGEGGRSNRTLPMSGPVVVNNSDAL